MQTVLFLNNSALLLSDIERDEKGEVRSAEVVNGGWRLEIKDGEALAKTYRSAGSRVVSRLRVIHYEEIQTNARGDYNHVIASAEKQRSKCSSST